MHHFENGVWLYKHDVIKEIKADMDNTMDKSIFMNEEDMKETFGRRFIRALVRAVSPML